VAGSPGKKKRFRRGKGEGELGFCRPGSQTKKKKKKKRRKGVLKEGFVSLKRETVGPNRSVGREVATGKPSDPVTRIGGITKARILAETAGVCRQKKKR